MKMFLSKYEPYIYAVLRIAAGFLFLWHGSQKVIGFPHASFHFPPLMLYGAGPIELIGGILIMVGLWTRWAAFITSGEMAVAYWMAHAKNALLPLLNGGELAFLYCFLFLYIASRGSGKLSIDNLLGKKSA
ncbi:MAG TPA: DoxX family protein [Bacteroidales bacterium]|nr:DoxX family protein [Bacteroidales bacterium]